MKLVELIGIHVEDSSGTPIVLLRERDEPHRVLPIFVGEPEAAAIALPLTGHAPSRPLTHDLMAELVERLGASLDRVEVTALDEGTFRAELALIGPDGEDRIDTRPSDAIALAVRLDTPVFVSDDVLDDAGALLEVEMDDDAIDDEVAQFAAFLDEVDPAGFGPAEEAEEGDPEVDGPA